MSHVRCYEDLIVIFEVSNGYSGYHVWSIDI